MFPFEQDEELIAEPISSPAAPTEWGLDFATGKPTGKIVSGAEAVKVWAWYALQIPRYRYEMYTWDYGSEAEELIGAAGSPGYISAEVKRMAEECLLANPFIIGVEDFRSEIEDDVLTVSMRLVTPFGEEEINVRE
jgi:hypothetical protein